MLAVQPAAPSAVPARAAASPADETSSSSSSEASGSGSANPAFTDDPQPGDRENPFREHGPAGPVDGVVSHSVSSRLAKSQSVIESLQRNLVTKLSPATIESLKSKYASTPAPLAPLARPDPGLESPTSPLLPVKSVAEVDKENGKPQANGSAHGVTNGKPPGVFDLSEIEGQRRDKLAFLGGFPGSPGPKPTRPSSLPAPGRRAVERKPLHVQVPKPPVPTKKDALRALPVDVTRKKSPKATRPKDSPTDGISELLKTLVLPAERPLVQTDFGAATATRPARPQPAPRTTSLPGKGPAAARPDSLSPVPRPSPATSPGRTPPERSRLLEDKLNEIRKDLWEEEEAAEAAKTEDQPGRRRHDSLPVELDAPAATPRSVQEATLEHYARAIQRHLDGRAGVPAPPQLAELGVDTSSSTHSSTSTLVSETASLPTSPRGRRPTEGSPAEKKRLRDELLGFYYRSLEREARVEARGPRGPGRSGRLSAPPGGPCHSLPVVIPTERATYTPDRTLRQDFIVVDDEATYQNVIRRPPPGSPLLASAEDSDSTVDGTTPRPRNSRTMNFFTRGGPQRSTIGAYPAAAGAHGAHPARRTPPKDEVDLRREHERPDKRRTNSESEAVAPVSGKAGKAGKGGKAKSGMLDWSSKKATKANGAANGTAGGSSGGMANGSGKKSLLFPIFRKGSLHPSPPTTPGTPPPTLPKRVSFSSATSPLQAGSPPAGLPGVRSPGDNGYPPGWPTRNGHASSPPTRSSRLDSSDSVFLPNDDHCLQRWRPQEQIYANQCGEGTYVNYSLPIPPDMAPNGYGPCGANGLYANGALYGSKQSPSGVYGPPKQSPSGVYGTKQSPSGMHGPPKQSPSGVYNSHRQPPSSLYVTNPQQSPSSLYGTTPQQSPSGLYGSAQPSPSALYGSAKQSPSTLCVPAGVATVYGSSAQSPSAGRSGPSQKPPSGAPTAGGIYGSTQQQQPSPSSQGVYGGRQQSWQQQSSPLRSPPGSANGSQAHPSPRASPMPQWQPCMPSPGGARPHGGPHNGGAADSSPGGTSVGSASFNSSFGAASTPGSAPAGTPLGQRLYGRTGLPPRAQSATPTMMAASFMTSPSAHSAPDRPLPPIPKHGQQGQLSQLALSESESGSEAGEVQRILQHGGADSRNGNFFKFSEEEWGVGGKGRGPGDLAGPPGGVVRGDEEMRRSGGRGGRGGRDDPRRHTLGGDHHSLPPQGGTLSRSMDLEMSAKQRKKSPMARGYPPPSNAMLFDDDPGIMSEVETSSTGFHRGGKQRSSLPVVRTPSKTLERPLGLVFLQYRNETKRALLPNEITSLDTVKALFVRSFCKQLTMEYLDSPHVKIYIHDSNKDMFYELEDHRYGPSHLRDIRDRSVLRLFESADLHGGMFPGAGTGLVPPTMWETDQSYFSEPEFDSEYQHQHIHKSKASKSSGVPPQPYYMTHSFPPGPPGGGGPGVPGSSATLPRGGSLMRAYSPAPKSLPPSDRLHAESGYMSSPERGGPRAYPTPPYPPSAAVPYEEGYYGQYGARSGSITPVIDEEASDTELMDEQYSLYGVKLPGPRGPPVPSAAARAPFPTPAGPPYDVTRIRVENMERQLANLTGLVQKALTHGPTHLSVPGAQGYRNASGEFDTHAPCSSASQDDPTYVRSDVKPPKLGKDKSVSFEKSVSFSDEPPDMNSPKQHSPQHGADTKPTKPAIKSSTLPRTSSQERDRHKPAPPPKPMSLSPGQYEGRNIYRDLQLTPEMYNQLRGLQKKAKDLRQEVRNLRRMSQAQAHSVRETIRDTFIKIRAMLITGAEGSWAAIGDAEKLRLSREEELYKQEMLRLEKDLTELESTVEELRGNVINRKTRVNMSDVENMALILSKSSKTVADLKVRFPGLQDEMKNLLSAEMDKVMREEKFLKEEPERLESALRRCKKLTGTLVTLKRLASVQEQRLPCPPGSVGADARLSPTLDDEPLPPTPNSATSKACVYGSARGAGGPNDSGPDSKRPENALDALLDELQTFAKPPAAPAAPAANQAHPPTMAEIGRRKGSIEATNPPPSNPTSSLRRLHSYPSSSDGGGNSPPNIARLQVSDSKPPVPERNADLLAKRVPPPPPPRTSSRSPLASPTSPSLPPRTQNPPSQPQMGTQGTLRRAQAGRGSVRSSSIPGADPLRNPMVMEDPTPPNSANAAASNSSSCESVNSQEGAAAKKERQEALEQRHQELLRKQRALQEQYARLQQLQRGTATVPTPDLLLKKTGSESNLLAKMGMQGLSAAAPMSGSLTHLATAAASAPLTTAQTTTSKIYETDIL